MNSEIPKLKIAQIASPLESVPPTGYGGTERVIHALTEELVRRGHEVTLFASGDSITSAKLEWVCETSLRRGSKENPYKSSHYDKLRHIKHAYASVNQFDIIHDNMGIGSLKVAGSFIRSIEKPVFQTVHNPINEYEANVYKEFQNINVVTISNNQGSEYLSLFNHAGVVYNGLNMEGYPFSAKPQSYLLFVGRISAEKGVHYAIEVAKKLDLRLILAAKLDYFFSDDIRYYQEFVLPSLSDQIKWVGEIDEAERNLLMSNSLALLHPVRFREPFGLVLIESLACGAPVISFPNGSIPEIVEDRKNGFVVNSSQEMIEAVMNIDTIDRKTCRLHALQKFNSETMANSYERLYYNALCK